MFGSKKKEIEEFAEEARKARIRKAIAEASPHVQLGLGKNAQFYGSDYRQFLNDIKKEPQGAYEKACSFAEKLLRIKPDRGTSEKMEEKLKTAYINASPSGVISLSILLLIVLPLSVVVLMIFGAMDFLFSVVLLGFSLAIVFLVYNYPESHTRAVQVKMSSDIVLAILYMVIYMRNNPSIEGAVKFAADNLSGPLSWDLKKLMWDVEVGVYDSVDSGLLSYLAKWKDKNHEFAESLHMLRNSTSEVDVRRDAMYDEAISIILNGTRERMKHYAQGLRMPVMLIHAMGVLLPIIGLVMFPIVVLFMQDAVKPIFIFVGYDIILPAFILWYMNYILQTKPPTFSQPDTSQAKGLPPLGKFRMGKTLMPVLPFAIMVSLPLLIIGAMGITSPESELSVGSSLLIIIGISAGIFTYGILDSHQKMKVRNDIEKIEDEFAEALFQLGNKIAGGTPIEVATDRAIENLKSMKIADFFWSISVNMKKLGFSFEQALFDREYGAVWAYPSRLIRSVMQAIVQSSEKGVRVASMSMLTVARYLKGMHEVKEEINEILGETVSSMRFLAFLLAPIISGVVVTMAVVIMRILYSLCSQIGSLSSSGGIDTTGFSNFVFCGGWGQGTITPPISAGAFQLVVGIYMLETVILLSFFINKIEYGDDAIGLRSIIATTIILATITYIASWFLTQLMFSGPIEQLLLSSAPPT
jgi:Flp pilus assembly protein TadB